MLFFPLRSLGVFLEGRYEYKSCQSLSVPLRAPSLLYLKICLGVQNLNLCLAIAPFHTVTTDSFMVVPISA